MSPFLPLCVQHSKGFPPGIVQARLESGKSAGLDQIIDVLECNAGDENA